MPFKNKEYAKARAIELYIKNRTYKIAKAKEYYQNNKEKIRVHASNPEIRKKRRKVELTHYDRNKEIYKLRAAKWSEKNPLEKRRNNLKKYNITLEEYDKMHLGQNGLCKICNNPETKKRKNGIIFKLSVDHCHITNKVRGLLCHDCNLILGYAKDSVETLKNSINYLEEK